MTLAQVDLAAEATRYGPWGLAAAAAGWIGYAVTTQVVIPGLKQRQAQQQERFTAEMRHSEAQFSINQSMGTAVSRMTDVVDRMADGAGELRAMVEGIADTLKTLVQATRANHEAIKAMAPPGRPDVAEHIGAAKAALNATGDDSAVHPPLNPDGTDPRQPPSARLRPGKPPRGA